MDKRKIVVTGVSGYWGSEVAKQLIDNPDNYVIGLDHTQPDNDIKGLDFIQSDIQNPLLVELLTSEAVDTVCHLAFRESHQPNETSFDFNVIGTMKVLGACAEAGVRRIILKSSTTVYGARPSNSAFLTEEHPLNGSRSFGTVRDLVEIEAFCKGFRQQSPDIQLTILRFPCIIGTNISTPITRYLKEPVIPTLMGFNPRMQLIHESDVIAALVHATNGGKIGVFNITAESPLTLNKIIGMTGKLPMPIFHLFAYWGSTVIGSSGLRLIKVVPIELDYIRYSWVCDSTKMGDEFGFLPQFSAEEALHEFAGHLRMNRFEKDEDSLEYDKERLRDTIDRRKRSNTTA
jgi:UDP-glucose 4-epimerase